ncbi:hypothetical protein ACQKOF_02045 [Lysinibacillus sp. NPDC093190]|uniref:hypothetical protein n=1 Tax=Lysinibacillus sp. NPDC093190 TaxID=3390575 RepID=UPI003CFFA9F8
MVFLLIIFYLISGNIVAYIYQKLGTKDSITYGIMMVISILIIFTVLYRNNLQFSGWYKGDVNDKLSKTLSKRLISIALLLLLLPPILSFLFHSHENKISGTNKRDLYIQKNGSA